MSKAVVRMTIVLVSVYLVMCYLVADIFAVDLWRQVYVLPFELCMCLCVSKQGVYHCKFVKWTAYGVFLQDAVVCSDVLFDWLPEGVMALVPPLAIAAGLTTTLTLAVRHYIKVKKIKRQWHRNRPY